MYSISDEYKQVLKSDEQQYDTYIILEDGTKVDSDISGLKPIFNLGEKIIGNFATKRIEFTLFNTSKYNITNQEFEVFVGIKINNDFNYISLGKFIANKPEIKDEAQDECSITAQNYSLKFKIPYKPILTFPCTIKEAIKAICEYLNIVYVENEFINSDYVLQEFFIDEDATFFDVIKILVEAGFANADINNTNSLIVKSPKKNIDYAFSLNELFELKKEDNKLGPINSIVASRIVADDGSTTEDVFARNETSIAKNGLYEYKIKQNDAIDYDRQTAVNNILNGILDFEYIPATIETVYNPAIEVGDIAEVPDVKTDTSFLLFAKEISADLSTGLMTIESTEETQTETDYKSATNKDKRRKTEAKINKLEGEITLLNQKTEENTQQIKNSITIVEVMYALSDSTSEAPTTGWSTVAPEWIQNKYMWQKTVTIQTDGTSVESEPTCISGATGQQGETGAQGETGVGVSEIIPQYYLSTSAIEQVDGEWSETQPEWSEGTYIWTRTEVKYTDGSIKYTTPVLAEAMNQTLKNTTEINEKYTEIKTTTESITNTVSDMKEVTNNLDGSIVEIEKSIDTLQQTVNGLENTLETQGGSNLLLNSSGLFESDYWEGNVESITNTEIQNNFIAKACFYLQNGSMKQTINVVNGTYYIGFKYKKLLELANCRLKINDIEIELTKTSLAEVDTYIDVSEHSITIELLSDNDDACLVGDIIVVQGAKQSWSSNMNEIYTSTVKIGVGLEIISNTMKTKLLANADGVRIVNTINNNTVAEFTDKGMKTDEIEAKKGKISGLLIQQVDKQVWLSNILGGN